MHGNLVHGNLNESHILVCAPHLVENRETDIDEDHSYNIQVVFTDFGHAVDVQHPCAQELLEKDLETLRVFFHNKRSKTMGLSMARDFVTSDPDANDQNEGGADKVWGGPFDADDQTLASEQTPNARRGSDGSSHRRLGRRPNALVSGRASAPSFRNPTSMSPPRSRLTRSGAMSSRGLPVRSTRNVGTYQRRMTARSERFG